ncbi:hypothetical protein Peur_006913 [Populus x canadensis]
MDLSSFTQLPSLNLTQNHLLSAAFSSLQSSPALSTQLPFVMPSSTEQGKKKTSNVSSGNFNLDQPENGAYKKAKGTSSFNSSKKERNDTQTCLMILPDTTEELEVDPAIEPEEEPELYCSNRTEEQIFAALECDTVGMLQATFVLQAFGGVVALWDFDNWQEVVG